MKQKDIDYEIIKEKDKFYLDLKEIIENKNIVLQRETLENNDVRYKFITRSQYISCWLINDIQDLINYYQDSYWEERIKEYDYFITLNYETNNLDIVLVVKWSV